MSTPSDDEVEIIRKQYEDYFDKALMQSFVLTIMFFAVCARLFVGVRQRLERQKDIIDVDADPLSR